MGFFSSRREAAAPLGRAAADSANKTTVIKSKWYGKSRPKSHVNALDIPSPGPSSAARMTSFDIRRDDTVKPNSRSNISLHSSHSQINIPNKADPVTVNLAQRLNELAAANADGLLGDDEYRLLRQNLFERFGAASQVPTETQIVKVPRPDKGLDPHRTSISFQSTRSTASRTSTVTGTVTGLIRKVTSRRRDSGFSDAPEDAAQSRRSSSLRPSTSYQQTLISHSSNGSLQSSISTQPSDLRSLSSWRTTRSSHTTQTVSGNSSHMRSLRGPPSSFHHRTPFPAESFGSEDDDDDKSAAQLRAEIAALEAEGRRLMDAFNGLELSALTKHQHVMAPNAQARKSIGGRHGDTTIESTWTLVPNRADAIPRTPTSVLPSSASLPLKMNRKMVALNSSSSFHSTPSASPSHLPPHLRTPSTLSTYSAPSNLNSSPQAYTRSPRASPQPRLLPPTPTTPRRPKTSGGRTPYEDEEEDVFIANVQSDVDEIRKSRAETMTNYEQKLEYLRAKLRGAEIRERLLKK
ncbi:hypothetical protein BOTBODRAFT_506136 [Botryobasidium botryosum FD-172 SS1]|uniref:Uncharacterized protein n=1 Tax=Botryobasidium botryosum (strain FD-172 SS1) TaxID=930990 RepID=A0A067M2B6_BOTB1|nr:hypothetical protein BOTBODRAFT_506136 [Botryobasidium botryosum FD-172 SS1]